jgi:hypothetical protein
VIISLSGKKRSGKTTVANYLIAKHGFVEVSWAEPLKEIIGRKLFGLTDDQLYGPAELREAVVEEWGKSPRQILQIVGTDLFRKHFDMDFWVKIGMREIKKHQAAGNNKIVISDTRFPNEAMAVLALKGSCINVRKIANADDPKTPDDNHASENALDNWEFDYVIQSFAGEIDLLYEKMEHVLKDLGEGKNAFSE